MTTTRFALGLPSVLLGVLALSFTVVIAAACEGSAAQARARTALPRFLHS